MAEKWTFLLCVDRSDLNAIPSGGCLYVRWGRMLCEWLQIADNPRILNDVVRKPGDT